VTHYVSELLRHEPIPSRVLVSVITGVPPELTDSAYDGLLADPAMQEVLDGDALVPSCSSGLGRATPPRRLVSWLAALKDARIQTDVHSICAPAFLTVLDNLLPRPAPISHRASASHERLRATRKDSSLVRWRSSFRARTTA